jgi:hypothetical protein
MYGSPDPLIAVRQAQRWLRAAKQDQHPAIRVLHANYAVATIDLIRQLWHDQQIQAMTGIDIVALLRAAMLEQDQAAVAIAAQCPAVKL